MGGGGEGGYARHLGGGAGQGSRWVGSTDELVAGAGTLDMVAWRAGAGRQGDGARPWHVRLCLVLSVCVQGDHAVRCCTRISETC